MAIHDQESIATLVDLLEYQANKHPNRCCFQFLPDDSNIALTMTYQTLAEEAKAIAVVLQEQGGNIGDRALLIYPPGFDLIKGFFGCLYAGIIGVPVYPPTNTKLLDKFLDITKNSQPIFNLSTTALRQSLIEAGISPEHQGITHTTSIDTDKINLEHANHWNSPDIGSTHLAFLQYTSGSTGQPKGVMVSHGNLLDNLNLLHQSLHYHPESKMVSWLPPYHDMGLIAGILSPLYSGFQAILMSPSSFIKNPVLWLDTISLHQATTTVAPNFAYDYCVKKINETDIKDMDLSCLQITLSGGEPIHESTLESFYKKFKSCGFCKKSFIPGYGLAEATLMVTLNSPEKGYQNQSILTSSIKKHSIEQVEPTNLGSKILVSSGECWQKIKIVDSKTRKECKSGAIGEIWVHSSCVTGGYWQNPEDTQDIFKANIKDDRAKIPYLRTGDLGFVIDDNLYVTGRIKDLIIIHSENYYPQDIEHTIGNCHMDIRPGQCAAFSIDVNGEEHLAVVCEVTPPKENAEQTYEQVCQSITEAIAEHHELVVYSISLIPPYSLPKTTSGKIRRRHIRELFLDNKLSLLHQFSLDQIIQNKQETINLPTTSMEKELCDLFEKVFEHSVGINDKFLDLGGDSLHAMQLASGINSYFQINIESHLFFENPSIVDLATIINEEKTSHLK